MVFQNRLRYFHQFEHFLRAVCQRMRNFEMNSTLMVLLTFVTAVTFVNGGLVPVRLVGGPSAMEGIVEVYYDNSWGSVCDDEINNSGCVVVCAQLGFSGGELIKKAADVYGSSTGKIWLDDVTCNGMEPDLNSCQHNFWGHHDCEHTEDIGCTCNPASTFPEQLPGTCNTERHRINPFVTEYPGIGRVEVRDDLGQWHTICDDYWDDIDAAVFCRCMGYTESSHFRAYWNQKLIKMEPTLDTVYDAVHCSVSDMEEIQNIWACETGLSSGLCDSTIEAAAVACEAMPPYIPPEAPATTVECDGNVMTVCFTNDDYTLKEEFMDVSPSCAPATKTIVTDGVCLEIPLHECTAKDITSDISAKHYCYDVSYVEPSQSNPLITTNLWERSSCCSLAKNGSIMASFHPVAETQPAIFTDTSVNYTVKCFLDDSFEQELEYPANVSRGQDLFCKISSETYDPKMWLIVPDCKFMPMVSGNPSFQFLDDKCPTSDEFGLNYYSFDGHNWGFKFRTPQFQGYNSLFIQCDCYICDPDLDDKPYCDRSCRDSSRKKRNALDQSTHSPRSRVLNGPFMVVDSTEGPLLSNQGELVQSVRMYDPEENASSTVESVGVFILLNLAITYVFNF